jgi:hypothetical protein
MLIKIFFEFFSPFFYRIFKRDQVFSNIMYRDQSMALISEPNFTHLHQVIICIHRDSDAATSRLMDDIFDEEEDTSVTVANGSSWKRYNVRVLSLFIFIE